MQRELKPRFVRFFVEIFKFKSQWSIQEFVANLDRVYHLKNSRQKVQNAIQDGILIVKTRKKKQIVCLPESEKDVEIAPYDFYCYECHLPGNLVKCTKCVRSFHRVCYRKRPDKPNYITPDSTYQKFDLPKSESSSSACSEDSDEEKLVNKNDTNKKLKLLEKTQLESNKTSNDDDDLENNFKPDLIYVDETLSPMHRRKRFISTNCKTEFNEEQKDNSPPEVDLCTCCRFLMHSKASPYIPKDELNYLISLSFENFWSWICEDVLDFMHNRKWAKIKINVLKAFLFKNEEIGIQGIKAKIQNKEYETLVQFFLDLLDFQHNIGIFFGIESEHFKASKWLVRDIFHDLNEICLCPDCFRHSNEKHKEFWFSRPCTQRHELVLAKVAGYDYWPAKVIRFTRRNLYDVRFFGEHNRALIKPKSIKCIDNDFAFGKIKKTKLFVNAMLEFDVYRSLQIYPSSYFGYNASESLCLSCIRPIKKKYQLIYQTSSPTKKRKYHELLSLTKPCRVRIKRISLQNYQINFTNNNEIPQLQEAINTEESNCNNNITTPADDKPEENLDSLQQTECSTSSHASNIEIAPSANKNLITEVLPPRTATPSKSPRETSSTPIKQLHAEDSAEVPNSNVMPQLEEDMNTEASNSNNNITTAAEDKSEQYLNPLHHFKRKTRSHASDIKAALSADKNVKTEVLPPRTVMPSKCPRKTRNIFIKRLPDEERAGVSTKRQKQNEERTETEMQTEQAPAERIVQRKTESLSSIKYKLSVAKTKCDRKKEYIKLLESKCRALQQQLTTTKLKQWCYCCLKEATILCCMKASFCSLECQNKTWLVHRDECTKKSDTRVNACQEPSSTT